MSIFVLVVTTDSGVVAFMYIRTVKVVGALSDASVEVLLPEGGSDLQLPWSGRSSVLGVGAVGGPPHCDLTNKEGAGAASRRRPHRLPTVLAGVASNVVGEVGDQP
jgi:hypothetical protein